MKARKVVAGVKKVTKPKKAKKPVVRKPKKKYIKLTTTQFKRITNKIKKNNLRKVLVKEITRR